MDPVGRPIVTMSSLQQATGEARYLDDIPEVKGKMSTCFWFDREWNKGSDIKDWSEILHPKNADVSMTTMATASSSK